MNNTKQNVVTKEDYKEKVLKRSILICWAILLICFIVKILGGNFFCIVCNNQKFIKLCNYVDNHKWLQIIVGYVSTSITLSLFLLSVCKKLWFSKKEIIIVAVTIFISVPLRIYVKWFPIIADIIYFVGIPLILTKKQPIEQFIPTLIFGNIVNFLFQLISILVKNVNLGFITDSFLTAIIFSIDVYIMLFLYYLYMNICKNKTYKGGNKMGLFLNWLFGKSSTQLNNMKEHRLKKIAKIEEEIKAIDEQLAKGE